MSQNKLIDSRIKNALNAVRNAFRGVLKSVKIGSVQTSVAEGLAGEDVADAEMFQHFGFRSNPPAGTQAVVLPLGGKSSHSVIIATEHGSYAVSQLESGETVIYNQDGAKIILKKNKIIDVECDDFNINCKNFKVNASTGAEFETPKLETSAIMQSATLSVIGGGDGGENQMTGTLIHLGGSIVSNGVTLHTHTHTEHDGPDTSKPK